MTHHKPHLPEKICAQCQRPFTWRKRWQRVWNEVRYCSERCRRAARQHVTPDSAEDVQT